MDSPELCRAAVDAQERPSAEFNPTEARHISISAGELNTILLLAEHHSPKGSAGEFEAVLMMWHMCGRRKQDAERLYHLAKSVPGYTAVRLKQLLDEGIIVMQPAVAMAGA